MSIDYPEISPEMLKEFEDQLSPKLRTPSENVRTRTYKTKKDGDVTQQNWRESAVIESILVTSNDSEAWGTHTLYKIKFAVTGTKGSGINVGKKVTLQARYNPTGEEWRIRNSKQALLLLSQIVRARGYDVAGGISSAQLRAYFPAEGESPMVNAEVEIEVANKTNSDFSEVVNIFKLVTAAADAEV